MRLAVLDIGSNSALLLIAETKGAGFEILLDQIEVIGLAKGLKKTGRITPEAEERATKALEFYKGLIQDHNVDRVIAVTTEALRKATNGLEVKEKLSKILNSPIETIDGDREAELSFWGVQKEHSQKSDLKLVFDIGGASTELCLGNEEGIQRKTSLKFGSVLLTEQFDLQKPSTMKDPVAWVKDQLKDLDWGSVPLGVGVAGTVTSLFSIHQGLTEYRRDLVHNKQLPLESVKMICQSILEMTVPQRNEVPGMPAKRADVIGGGFCILIALMEHFRWSEVTCMDSGVRFGLVYEAISRDD